VRSPTVERPAETTTAWRDTAHSLPRPGQLDDPTPRSRAARAPRRERLACDRTGRAPPWHELDAESGRCVGDRYHMPPNATSTVDRPYTFALRVSRRGATRTTHIRQFDTLDSAVAAAHAPQPRRGAPRAASPSRVLDPTHPRLEQDGRDADRVRPDNHGYSVGSMITYPSTHPRGRGHDQVRVRRNGTPRPRATEPSPPPPPPQRSSARSAPLLANVRARGGATPATTTFPTSPRPRAQPMRCIARAAPTSDPTEVRLARRPAVARNGGQGAALLHPAPTSPSPCARRHSRT